MGRLDRRAHGLKESNETLRLDRKERLAAMRTRHSPLTLLLILGGLTMTIPGGAQVARQATPQDLGTDEATVEVASPMLIDLSMGASEKKKSFADATMNGRTFYETKKFVCDKARIPKVTAMKRPGKNGSMLLEVTPVLKTEWYRQSVSLTVAVVSGGKAIKSSVLKDLTIGSDDNAATKAGCLVCGASSSKLPVVNFEFSRTEWEAIFASGDPNLRLVLTVEK